MEYGAARQPSSNKEGRPFCEGRGRCGIPYIRLRHPPERERQASLHDISSLVHTGYAPRLRHWAHTEIPGPRQLSYARTVRIAGAAIALMLPRCLHPCLRPPMAGKSGGAPRLVSLLAGWLAGAVSCCRSSQQLSRGCRYLWYVCTLRTEYIRRARSQPLGSHRTVRSHISNLPKFLSMFRYRPLLRPPGTEGGKREREGDADTGAQHMPRILISSGLFAGRKKEKKKTKNF